MTEVFAVFRRGVYRHECGGVFTSYEAAYKAATDYLQGEPDDYHHYEILVIPLNGVFTQEKGYGGSVNEPQAFISFTR